MGEYIFRRAKQLDPFPPPRNSIHKRGLVGKASIFFSEVSGGRQNDRQKKRKSVKIIRNESASWRKGTFFYFK